MRVVPVPQSLDDKSLDQLAAGLGAWPPDTRLLVDAHATEWASPVGFTGLLTLGQSIAEVGGPKPQLALPGNDNVRSYWAKTGFLQHAADVFELHGKVPRRRSDEHSDVLLPITPIRDASDVHQIIEGVNEKVTSILKNELDLEASVVGGFSQSLSEMCQNVVEHAGTGGWVAAHVYAYRRRLGRRVAVISVSDAGIGFRRGLEATQAKRIGDRWGDALAVETALIHGISRFRDPGRGQGLAFVKRYLARWSGKISIRSGTARVAIVPAWDDDLPLTDGLAWFPGSQVTIVIPARETPT